MARYVVTALLILTILNGCLGVSLAIYLRAKHPTHAKVDRYLLRGILSIILGSIALLLFRSHVINVWTALLPVSFLLMLGEYLLAAREKRQLIRKGLYDSTELEDRERQEWEKVRIKGKSRYVWEKVVIYGIGGFLLIAALNISMPEKLPLYTWVVGSLFAAFCGGVAALEKWKRQKH